MKKFWNEHGWMVKGFGFMAFIAVFGAFLIRGPQMSDVTPTPQPPVAVEAQTIVVDADPSVDASVTEVPKAKEPILLTATVTGVTFDDKTSVKAPKPPTNPAAQ